jgi:phospholipid transport system substrate-binding protein
MRARSFLVALPILLLVALGLPLKSVAAAADPAALLTDVSSRVLKLIDDKQRPDAERAQDFTTLVDETFDVPKIARFVLGQNWRTASDDERQQFTQTFQTYLIQVYWSRFNQYNGQSFKVTGQRAQSDALTVVNTQIVQPNGPLVKVDWTVNKAGDSFKIIDVSIEGVSQVLTYRQEFASILAQNDGHVSALTAELAKKLKS